MTIPPAPITRLMKAWAASEMRKVGGRKCEVGSGLPIAPASQDWHCLTNARLPTSDFALPTSSKSAFLPAAVAPEVDAAPDLVQRAVVHVREEEHGRVGR